MTKDGGLRIATAGGALLVDPDAVHEGQRPVAKGVPGAELDTLFEPAFWASSR